jgi:Fe-S oxidoreductase
VLSPPEKVLFIALAAISVWFTILGFRRVLRIIGRGSRRFHYPRWDRLPRRLGAAIVRTLSQSTVFKDRPGVSTFHAFVFYGFVYYLLVNGYDAARGLLPLPWTALDVGIVGDLFRLGADVLSVLILVGVVFFLVRRFGVKDRRLDQREGTLLHARVRSGEVRRDSAIVGAFILGHVGFRLLGEGFFVAHEGRPDAWQPFASTIAGLVGYAPDRIVGWHVGWWGALGLILAFLPYFPRSKHIHLFAAPAKFTLERRHPDGAPVPLGALEPIDFEDETAEQYGAASLEHLRVPQLLDAYACIQCNRCTNVCPANVTGKVLSPAALEINKRYEVMAHAESFAAGAPSPRPLVEFAISPEAVWACTACGACMEICPVGCEQMIDIIDIRRDLVMMQGEFPSELQSAFRGMERSGNPWGLAADARLDWADRPDLTVPTTDDNPGFEVLFWVGCAGSYDPAAQATTRAMARLLERAGVNYAVLGQAEKCTGDPARRAGNEYLYYQLASENVLVLNEALAAHAVEQATSKKIVTTCPHCFNALLNDYPQLGGHYDVVHHTQFLDMLVAAGRLAPLGAAAGSAPGADAPPPGADAPPPGADAPALAAAPPPSGAAPLTFHDPCYLGRHNGEYEAPRRVLDALGAERREMPRSRASSFCCGAGGAQFWKEEEPGERKVADERVAEALATGAGVVAVGCPFCKVMLGSASGAPTIKDVAQLLDEGYAGRERGTTAAHGRAEAGGGAGAGG